MSNYPSAREQFAQWGVDTESALEALASIPVSLHCWQGDDVVGFETHSESPTSGGIQALRNFGDIAEFRAAVYAQPQYIDTLATSTAISAHVPVDFELRGCPIDKRQLIEVITAFLAGRKPVVPDTSVCSECKRRGLTCVMVADGTPCLGPVTHAGCGALCPAVGRGCYGCFGPMTGANLPALTGQLRACGMTPRAVDLVLSTFNAAAPGFAHDSAELGGLGAGEEHR